MSRKTRPASKSAPKAADPARPMRCIGVSIVRNESDIIELFVRYNLQLLDELHVIDNLSSDKTRWVLEQLRAEGLQVHLYALDSAAHLQEHALNALARKLIAAGNGDFFIPLDADELLAVPSRPALHSALAAIAPDVAGVMHWQTYLPETGGDGREPFFLRMRRHRSIENANLGKLILSADLCRTHSWTAGSHNALNDRTAQPVVRADVGFRLAHFPVRDAEQLARKVIVGAHAIALKSARTGLVKNEAWHWQALAQRLREADCRPECLDLESIALAYSLGPQFEARQKAVLGGVPDQPAARQRYPTAPQSLVATLGECLEQSAREFALLGTPKARSEARPPDSVVLEELAASPSNDAGTDSTPATGADAAQHWRALRDSPAQSRPWLALARVYKARDLLWQAAYAARQALRCDAGLAPQLQALEIGAWKDATAGDAQLGRPSLDQAAQLTEQFSKQVQACPGDWLTWLYLARLREMRESGTQAAQDALRHAQALEPVAGESLHWMGVWRMNAGDAAGAVTALSGLLDIRPMRHGSMMYLGEALLREGKIEAAQKAFARASLSGNPDFLAALAARVYGHNYWNEAIEVLNKALALRPASVPLLLSLAKIQSEVYSLADCQASLRRVKALDPDNAEARLLEAGLKGRMGDAKGHLATLEASYAASGDPLSRVASSIAMTLLYQDDLTPEEVAERHRRLCAPIEKAFARTESFSNPRTTGRKLRIGYVTGDIHRQHPVNIFMLPVLLRQDHAKFEVSVYHTGAMHDEYTRQARAGSDRWLEAAALDDKGLRRAIMADGIDVLVDLAGHTSGHRLGVFAMRAAPVQATFLGYPYSTGLSRIDWIIADGAVAPAEHAHLFSEGIAQLPDCVWCWAPVDSYALPKARSQGEPVVFGSFNNAMKLSPRTIALWARVLEAVPDSRLLLKAPSLRDEMVQKRFADLFAGQGIARERLTFRGPVGLAEMMQEYGDVDIGLDPTPYNGGTTTLQALWMGVPVVCLEGGNFAGRMGASFMRTLGRPAWVAADEAGYVKAAERLAREIGDVRAGRARLREAMSRSKLCDIETYVKNFEAMLGGMWATYCAGDSRRVLNLGKTGDAAR